MIPETHIRTEADEGFRLSTQQTYAWNAIRATGKHPSGVQCIVRISKRVDVGRFRAAIGLVAQRHEIIRTQFKTLAGTSIPVQVISAECDHALTFDDAVDPNTAIGSSFTAHFAGWETISPSHPWSFVLQDQRDGSQTLIVTASALCADAYTVLEVCRELCSTYSKGVSDEPPLIQYADFTEWQNELREEPQAQGCYWSDPQFNDLSFAVVPFVRCNGELHTPSFTQMGATLTPSIFGGLTSCAVRFAVSVPTILFAALNMALYRYRSQERFISYITLSGRESRELGSLMGPVALDVPVISQVDERAPLSSLLEFTRSSVALASYDRELFNQQQLPDRIYSAYQESIPILFTDLTDLVETFAEFGTSWQVMAMHQHLNDFTLGLTVTSTGDALKLVWRWNEAKVARVDISHFAGYYMALIEDILKFPDDNLRERFKRTDRHDQEAPASSAASRDQCFVPVHRLIEREVNRVPDRIALVSGDRAVTYSELARRSANIDHAFMEAGITRQSVIAIIAERSEEFIIAVAAVLRFGCAWLPIELPIPAERVAYMLRHLGVAAIVAQPETISALGVEDIGVPVVPLVCAPASVVDDSRRIDVSPQELAYVMFTSGSTGKPKGVGIEHAQLTSYLTALAEEQQLQDGAHYGMVSTLMADLGLSLVFGALTSGGSLHVIPAHISSDMQELSRYLSARPIDLIKATPTHLEATCREVPSDVMMPWRSVILGGEPLAWRSIETIQVRAPKARIYNEYGPTETTVGVVCTLVDRLADPFVCQDAPIGTPREGTTAYALNSELQAVPAWVPGELYIGGSTVGRGYMGAPDLTAEKFIPNPFSHLPGARMYRTGDIVRRRSDGNLQFLGREDRQVKLRGFRVELGEIEAVFLRHPLVGNATVALVGEKNQEKELIAWVVAKGKEVTETGLRQFLERSLPLHMIPADVRCVDRLEVNSNGKIDYKALLSNTTRVSRDTSQPPFDEIEESLLSVWQTVLCRQDVGVNDNYFSLGGDSLRVTQLVHLARKYGVQISTRDVLQHQSIRKIRAAMGSGHTKEDSDEKVPFAVPTYSVSAMVPDDLVESYPATAMQMFILQSYSESRCRVGPFHIQDNFRLKDETFSLPAIESACRALIHRHPALRTAFDLAHEPPMQLVRRSAPWKLTFKDISNLDRLEQDAYVDLFLEDDRRNRFDVSDPNSSLFRAGVLRRSRDEFNLILSCHHAIMDGWGHRILLAQLEAAYAEAKTGAPLIPGTPDSACKELAHYLYRKSQTLSGADFWEGYLDGIDRVARSNRIPQSCDEYEPTVITKELNSSLAKALVHVARKRCVSMQALLLGVWFNTLQCWASQDSVAAAVVINGRSEYLSDPLSSIGLFWNLLPIVSRGPLDILDLAAAAHNDLIKVLSYSWYPLTRLLERYGSDLPFYSTFRYVNFWHSHPLGQAAKLQFLGGDGQDPYPFPLNLLVAITSEGTAGHITLDCSSGYLRVQDANDILSMYLSLLTSTAFITKS